MDDYPRVGTRSTATDEKSARRRGKRACGRPHAADTWLTVLVPLTASITPWYRANGHYRSVERILPEGRTSATEPPHGSSHGPSPRATRILFTFHLSLRETPRRRSA